MIDSSGILRWTCAESYRLVLSPISSFDRPQHLNSVDELQCELHPGRSHPEK
jgi:hypothetical protein